VRRRRARVSTIAPQQQQLSSSMAWWLAADGVRGRARIISFVRIKISRRARSLAGSAAAPLVNRRDRFMAPPRLFIKLSGGAAQRGVNGGRDRADKQPSPLLGLAFMGQHSYPGGPGR